MNCKEDLIGTEWKCPQCQGVIVINKDGIRHSCDNYMVIKPLQDLFDMCNYLNNKTFYGPSN